LAGDVGDRLFGGTTPDPADRSIDPAPDPAVGTDSSGDPLAAVLRLAALALLVIAVVVVYRQRKAIRSIVGHPRSPRQVVAALFRLSLHAWRGLRAAMRSLVAWVRRLFGVREIAADEPIGSEVESLPVGEVGTRAPWTDEEARLGVARIYGRFERFESGGGGRRPPETPAEYLRRLPPLLPRDPAAALTAVYEEARFSSHDITDAHVVVAREAWEEVEASLHVETEAGPDDTTG
jgi:hypothetical protein